MARVKGRKKQDMSVLAPSIPSSIIRDQIGHCEDIEEYNNLVKQHAQHYIPWSVHICQLMSCYGVEDSAMAEGLGVSNSSITNFKKAIPTERKNIIMMALYMGLSVEKTDELLVRWAKFSRLYAKNPEDALWIYLLEKGGSKNPKLLFDAYWAVYEEERKGYYAVAHKSSGVMQETRIMRNEIHQYAARQCSQTAAGDMVYREMVRRHMPEYDNAHIKLMNHLERHMNFLFSTEGSANQLFQNNAYFQNQYYERMKALRRTHELPSRTFLVALALHLNLDATEIDGLLELAGMGPLCAKDRMDSALIFYLEELYSEYPSRFFNLNKLRSDTDYYGLRDADTDGTNTEKISDYMKRRMQELSIDEPDKKRKAQLDLLLKML